MTPRESLGRSKRHFALSLWIGFPLWLLVVVFTTNSTGVAPVLMITGVVLYVAWIITAWYKMRCPACGENLFTLLMANPWSLTVPAKMKSCPYCSVHFDNEI